VGQKLRAFAKIMEFHAHVASRGYVALDFYDGSILYDYANERVIICDVDLYQKAPFINADKLGIVGSARYVSPEECAKDEVLDEITNVYTMGATAFALFTSGDRNASSWPLSMASHAVAARAVSDERAMRQQSVGQLIAEWNESV
ncbi:MAG: serine/threonine protein kinase, partial [Defluviitaleaceae bacterium]|nr:serine/threonine protein kinase [Defluviitaleaceae bacterium]